MSNFDHKLALRCGTVPPEGADTVRTVGSSEDPMKSEALRAWLRALPAPKNSFLLQSGRSAMDTEKYVHRENLALFKKRLAEAHSDAEREVLLKLLADEEAKEPPRKMAFSSRVDLHQ